MVGRGLMMIKVQCVISGANVFLKHMKVSRMIIITCLERDLVFYLIGLIYVTCKKAFQNWRKNNILLVSRRTK